MHYASNSPIFLSFTRFSSLIQLARINHSVGISRCKGAMNATLAAPHTHHC
jgi:hypothetical protein